MRAGDAELALKYLARAREERNVLALLIDSDPLYDGLRSDPRFKDLLESVGLRAGPSPAPP